MISRGFRKFIRKEKARLRREIIDAGERQRQIDKLYPVRISCNKPQR